MSTSIGVSFSAQPRADGDEAQAIDMLASLLREVSVLNREPMGMKQDKNCETIETNQVSVLNREPMGMKLAVVLVGKRVPLVFQCSTASRWG